MADKSRPYFVRPTHLRYGQRIEWFAYLHRASILWENPTNQVSFVSAFCLQIYSYFFSSNSTTSTKNLKYLSVDQSLADLAHFVREITADKQLNATGGVIVVGGSYSATMAAWFRQKYPHLVKGAWASSAPLQAKVNFFEYTETVGKSIRKIGGEECYENIETAFEAIEDLITNDDMETLKKLFNICDDFDTENVYDVYNFIWSIKNVFSGIVQGYRCVWILN